MDCETKIIYHRLTVHPEPPTPIHTHLHVFSGNQENSEISCIPEDNSPVNDTDSESSSDSSNSQNVDSEVYETKLLPTLYSNHYQMYRYLPL